MTRAHFYESTITAISLMFIAGCSNPQFDRMQANAVASVQNLRITCTDGSDCTTRWARALQWVTENSPFKLRIATDSVITTEGPLDEGGYSTESAITVNKVSSSDGTSEIVFNSGCANEFGCVPTHEMLLSRFANFVMAGSASPGTKARFGVHYVPLDARLIAALHLPEDHGLIVGIVDEDSPAAKAGIKKADVILSFAGRATGSAADLQGALATVTRDQVVPVHIWRGGQELDLSVQF